MSLISQNSWQAWLLAARPKTLAGAAVPVLIGGALAWGDVQTEVRWMPMLLCLLFALIMQIDANFVNDYFDFVRGNDDETRLGPKRACAEGWVSARAMRYAIAFTTILACLVGLPLVFFGGWLMIVVGMFCVLFCFLYTTTLSYIALGDVLVVVFFGLVPVGLTYYLSMPEGQQTISQACWIVALACGLVVDTLLVVNNYRDIDNDRRAGKRTLVVLLGRRRSEILYLCLGLVACGLCSVFLFEGQKWAFLLLLPSYLPLHIHSLQTMCRIGEGVQLNQVLAMTARNILVFGMAVAVGLLLLHIC